MDLNYSIYLGTLTRNQILDIGLALKNQAISELSNLDQTGQANWSWVSMAQNPRYQKYAYFRDLGELFYFAAQQTQVLDAREERLFRRLLPLAVRVHQLLVVLKRAI